MKLKIHPSVALLVFVIILCWATISSAGNLARFEGEDIILENNLVKITFSAEYGQISSWIIKGTNQQLVADGDYKGFMCLRLYPGTWVGGWPTEIGRAVYSNQILANSWRYAAICQNLTLYEDHFAKGIVVKKYYMLRNNSYNLQVNVELSNPTGHEISYNGQCFLLTVESMAKVGSGGRLAYRANGNITIQENGGAFYDNFDFMALENESQDVIFGSYFLNPNPQSAWALESNGSDGRDIEPHFGPYILSQNEGISIKMVLYGGPGNFNAIENLILSKEKPFPREEIETTVSPDKFTLFQNYPNPFNPTTQISFENTEYSKVQVTVYNMNGQEINTLTNDYYQPGVHSLEWNGKDRYGHKVPSGIYLYKVKANSFCEMKKMTLIR